MLKDFDYQKMHDLCVAFRTLSNQEFQVFELLFSVPYFEGNYSDIGRQINIDVSNARRAVLKLEARGMVYIVRENPHIVKCVFLVDGWYDMLIKSANGRKQPLENIKRKRKEKK